MTRVDRDAGDAAAAQQAELSPEQYFRALLEHAHDVTVVLDAAGAVTYCSPSVEPVFGYTADELIGRNVLEFIHPDEHAEVRETLMLRAASRDVGEPVEYRVRRKDGTYSLLELIGNSLFHHPAVRGLVINARDITARREAELQSRRNEERLRAAQHLAGLGDWEWDVEADRVIWSDQLVRIFGLEAAPAKFDLSTYLRHVHPDDRLRVEAAVEATIDRGVPFCVDHRIVRSDGDVRFLHCRGYAERDGQGQVVRMAGTAQDLTEVRRTEQRLQRRVEIEAALSRVSGLFVSAGDTQLDQVLEVLRALVHADRAYIILADDSGVRMHNTHEVCAPGVPPQIQNFQNIDPAAFPWWMSRMHRGDVVCIPDRERLPARAAAERAALAQEAVMSLLAVPIMSARGVCLGCIGFDVMAQPREWADEDVRALRLVAELISSELDRRDAADALRKSEERNRFLLEQVPGVFWMTDRELRFTYSKFTGANDTPPELFAQLGSALSDYFGSDDPEYLPIAMHRRALAGERVAYDMCWKDRTFQSVVEPLRDRSGEITGTVGIALDVTERVALEEQLRLAQKMEAVGRLAGGIAHDFNNVLTSISGHVTLLLDDTPRGDPRRADLEEVRRAAERAAGLTGQLLAFGRKQLRQPRVLSIGAVLSDMERMLRRLIGEDITLYVRIAPDTGHIEADYNQLQQVLLNLIVNARDAMPNGGCLYIDVRDVALLHESPTTGAPSGNYVSITVRDTGTGIRQEIMPHIFEPFFTSKPAGQGTGLGLATVYSIVQQTAGFIEVTSEEHEGTCFTILLPRVAPTGSEPVAPEGSTLPRGSEKVLLVEDEAPVRSLARRVLERNGYQVRETTGVAEAMAALEAAQGDFDVVVTDVVMPGQNGRELAEQIAARWPDVRVLFTSGYTEDEVLRRGVFLASDAFLPKPFTPAELCRKLRAVLDAPARQPDTAALSTRSNSRSTSSTNAP